VKISTKDPRYKMPVSTRKFDGKPYYYFATGTKEEANRDAKRLKSMGSNVRIVPWKRKYTIYTRHKGK